MAAGCISKMQLNMRNHLSESARFQTLVGAANAAAALTSIHLKRLPKPEDNRDEYTKEDLDNKLPYALVYMDYANGFTFTKDSETEYVPSGRIRIYIAKKMKAEHKDNADGDAEFEDDIGVIMEEMNVLAADPEGNKVHYDRLEIVEGPWHNELNDAHTQGDLMHVMLAATFGPGA